MILELENRWPTRWLNFEVYSIAMVSYADAFKHWATVAHAYAWRKSVIKIIY